MRKRLFLLMLPVVFTLDSYCQTKFENGYFINRFDEKIYCLVKNLDWKDNPEVFDYKLTPNENVFKADIDSVKEFGIIGGVRYIKAKVNIDKSSSNSNNLSSERNPKFQEEVLFLKALVEGNASLFLYENNTLTRFFYRINDSLIKQLVYKTYLSKSLVISENNLYKQQIINDLICRNITAKDIEKSDYKIKDLMKLFVMYNEFKNSDFVNYAPKKKINTFNLTVRPGLNSGNLGIGNYSSDNWSIEFGRKSGFRFGVENEYVLPYFNSKWSLFVEPTYQYYKSENIKEVDNISGGRIISKVDYKSIELPAGIRHYFYLSDQSKIFVNVAYIYDFTKNSSIVILRDDNSIVNDLKINSGKNYTIGFGYNYNSRFSFEFRYLTNRSILSDYIGWDSNYNTMSFIFGYTIL